MEKETSTKVSSTALVWANKKEIALLVVLSLFAGLLVKFPTWMGQFEDIFYRRNFAFIFLPGLSIYFGVKNNFNSTKHFILIAFAMLSAIFINAIPGNDTNDAFIMSCVHMVILWYFIMGISYVGSLTELIDKRIEFIKF